VDVLLQAVVASYDRVFPAVDEEAVGDVDDNCEFSFSLIGVVVPLKPQHCIAF